MTNGFDVSGVRAAFDCRPGDTLIGMKRHRDRPLEGPELCRAPGISYDHPTSTELVLRELQHECRCLVIENPKTGWVYVLVDGSLGWISHTSLDRLERADEAG